MKKTIKFLLVSLMFLTFFGCSQKEEIIQDDSPITFYVALGNNASYYNQLKEVIKDELGYEIEFVYQSVVDTTLAARTQIKNNDIPADIMVTASPTDISYLKNSTLDLMSYTHLTDYFTSQKIEENTTEDGCIYQLPFTSRLIGITYNETLLNEMGWDIPQNFDDMLDLKQKCDEANIKFAVSAGVATGHGFNYLFHTMGAQWLNTLEGSKWIKEFLAGEADISQFKEQASYFAEWVKNGLFGSFHNQDWAAANEYCQTRALFFFDLTNSLYTYEGDIVDKDGNVIGQVNDKFKSIPWLSKDGSTNCYTYYDNMYLSLNKNLANEDQKDRLAKCIEILELMTTEKVTSIFKNTYEDGYVAVNSFDIDESRSYYQAKQNINDGYLMPWYYSYFNNDSIIATGELINNYIKDGSSTLDEIMNKLEECRDNTLNSITYPICEITETLSYKQTAKLISIGALRAYQNLLDEQGINELAQIALIPYVEDVKDYIAFSKFAAIATKAYKGEFSENDINTILTNKANKVIGIHLKGSEVKQLINDGLNVDDTSYPYAYYSRDEIQDDLTYLVVTSQLSLTEDLYNKYLNNNQIVTYNESILSAQVSPGIKEYLIEQKTISPSILDD